MLRSAVGAALVIVAAGACSSSKSQASTTAAPPTAAPTTVPTAPTALTVVGVSPGVEQAGFYPTTTISSVTCGTSPNGRFVALAVPAGGAGTTAHSALTEATTVVVVGAKGELKDRTGKVLYEQDQQGVTIGTTGAFVLSLNSVSYQSGDGLSVQQGAVNISGTYACPAASAAFPGL